MTKKESSERLTSVVQTTDENILTECEGNSLLYTSKLDLKSNNHLQKKNLIRTAKYEYISG